MSTAQKPSFLFLFREPADSPDLTPAEMQQIVGQWMAWKKSIEDQGRYLGGNRLEDAQKLLRGRTVTDGPFAEAKEVINGYFAVAADSLDHAVALAQGCPGLGHGIAVEVRPMLLACD